MLGFGDQRFRFQLLDVYHEFVIAISGPTQLEQTIAFSGLQDRHWIVRKPRRARSPAQKALRN